MACQEYKLDPAIIADVTAGMLTMRRIGALPIWSISAPDDFMAVATIHRAADGYHHVKTTDPCRRRHPKWNFDMTRFRTLDNAYNWCLEVVERAV